MSNSIMVTKRGLLKQPLDLDKIHRVATWAGEGLDGVSVSQVEISAQIQFYDGMPTREIHQTLTKAAADLISENVPDYQYFAARLAMFSLRKDVYGDFQPPTLLEHVKKLVSEGRYDAEILKSYSDDELNLINSFIDHSRDLNFAYAAVKQMEGKYLVQDRVTKKIFETPQFLYIMIAATLFAKYPKHERLQYVKAFYDATSLFKISLPTPIMAGVRTPTRQFSSCVVISAGDSLDEINAASAAIVKYVSQRAGIGINAGMIRGIMSPIRGGEAYHTGCIPFFKHFQTAVKSCSQGGVRGGAATLFYPLWHIEAESLLVLKNNRGVEENRVRHLDYGIQINKTLYKRFLENKDITLFSPSDVPGLYDAFFADQDKFEYLYTMYENDQSIRKITIKARELFGILAGERASTGRIYIHNVDHTNTHGSFDPAVAPIIQSNLCMEIALPTKPIQHTFDDQGEISLCTLSAFNLGNIESLHELESLSDLLVRALDELLDYQNYPLVSAKKSTMYRRPLGVGVTNYAYYLAKNGVRYSDGSANELTHRLFESIQYYLLKASNNLAKERGACPGFHETKYAKGLLPIDTYKKDVDSYCNVQLEHPWEEIRSDILEYGLRNSTLTAIMPCETSSQITNSTNGIEPPRGFVSVKSSKDGVLKQVVPDLINLRSQYELLWDIPSNDGYLQLTGIMQKFIDQAISANTNYDPSRFENGKVPMKLILKDLLTAYKYGLKTLYYHNTRDGATDASAEETCDGGACSV